MSGKAAYLKKVQVSTTGVDGTWKNLPSTSPSLEIGGDVLDDTTLMNSGYRSRVLGLHDFSVSADSNWEPDNDAIPLVRAAKLNRTDLYVQYLPDGVTASLGLKGKVVVETFNMSGDVGDLESVSISLQGSGPLSVSTAVA
jgi:hypothetical protein